MNLIEKRIEEAIQSLENIRRAEMAEELHHKILNRITRRAGKEISIRPQTLWRAAAAIALLIIMNVFSMVHFNKSNGAGAKTESNVFAQEYFSYTKQAQF